jgi:hypothetical protein
MDAIARMPRKYFAWTTVSEHPLYGRRTFSLSLEPMSLREAVQFLPNYSLTDQIAAYATFGGIPHYRRLGLVSAACPSRRARRRFVLSAPSQRHHALQP